MPDNPQILPQTPPPIPEQYAYLTREYYGTSVTDLPFGHIIKGGENNWPLWTRFVLVSRKLLSRPIAPAYAQCLPVAGRPLTIEELPLSIQGPFRNEFAELKCLGYEPLKLSRRESTIGAYLAYSASFIGSDRSTLWNVEWFCVGLGPRSRAVWVSNLGTDLNDGSAIFTLRGGGRVSGPRIPARWNLKQLPAHVPNGDLLRRHQERLKGLPADSIRFIPERDTLGYLLSRATEMFKERMAAGGYRQLTPNEVEKLSRVKMKVV